MSSIQQNESTSANVTTENTFAIPKCVDKDWFIETVDKINHAHEMIQISRARARIEKNRLNTYRTKHLYDEYGIQNYLADAMKFHKIKYYKEYKVKCGGRIDFLTDKAIIEVKKSCSVNSLYRAIGQLVYYQKALEEPREKLILVALGEPTEYGKTIIDTTGIYYYNIKDLIERDTSWALIKAL